jgi:predicted NAD/FAD-dependent oxidoreductase
MLQLAQSAEVPFDGCFVNEGPLRWVARNSSKPGRPAAEGWVLHASGEWTADHVDATPGDVLQALTAAFAALVPAVATEGAIVHGAAHRWLYSQAEIPLKEGFLWSSADGLGVAGDWLNGSRVEGAWLSGVRLAERILA